MIPTEPTWRSYIVETTGPVFSPKQCQMVIDKGMSLKKETAAVGMGQNLVEVLILKKELLQ